MSQMFAEQVGVDFNVGGNFSASLSQMVAQADQFARSSDTLIGTIGKLNIATVGLINSTAKLTGVHKVATAEAASYQQKLAGIAATAAVTGKSFSQLEQSTLGLARSTGNLDQAVRIVEVLSTSGVTATKSIAELSKVWTQLGAANGLDPVALGSGLLTLNRQFGNSESLMRGFGDTLTGLSKKYGASADAVLSFSNAIGPVASQVGMSQGAVMGLATAAARLGQDGAPAANAFARVLIDMSHSIRDGTPEIRTYAASLNMTQQGLANLFKTDPTQVLIRFTDAIRTGGAQAMRTLEALGLDGPRTIRSIQAVAAQGNLGTIINDAAGQFGSGSTAKAAEAALDGVNHQMERLNETLAQTVQSAGKPFLFFLEGVLKAANAIAEAIHSIVASPLVQWIGMLAAPLRFLSSVGFTVAGTLGIAAVGRQLVAGRRGEGAGGVGPGGALGMVSNFRAGLMTARDFEGQGGLAIGAGAPLSARFGYGLGTQIRNPLFGEPGVGARGLGAFSLLGALRGSANWMTNVTDMQTRMIDPLTGRQTPYSVPGMAARDRFGAIFGTGEGGLRGPRAEGDFRNSIERFGGAIKDSGKALGIWAHDVTTASGSTRNLGGALARLVGQMGMGAGVVAGGAISGLGKLTGALGLNPAMLGITAGLVGFEAIQGMRNADQQRWEDAKAGLTDAYGQFNKFAAAAGIASKGVVSLGTAAAQTASQLAAANPNITSAGGKLSPEQLAMATSLGYKAPFQAVGTSDPNQAAAQAAALIASSPNDQNAVSQIGMSLVKAFGPQQGQAAFEKAKQMAQSPATLQTALLGAGVNSFSFLRQSTGETQALQTASYGAIAQQQNQAVSVYGAAAAPQGAAKGAQAAYEVGLRGGDKGMAAKSVSEALGMGPGGEGYVRAALDAGYTFAQLSTAAQNKEPIGGAGSAGTGTPNAAAAAFDANSPEAQGQGQGGVLATAPANVGQLPQAAGLAGSRYAGGIGANQSAVASFEASLVGTTGRMTHYADAIYGLENLSRKQGQTTDQLSQTQIDAMGGIKTAMANLANAPTAANVQAAGGLLANQAFTGTGGRLRTMTGGNISSAIAQLFGVGAQMDPNDPRLRGVQNAISQLQARQEMLSHGQSMMARTAQGIAAGAVYAQMAPSEDPQLDAQRLAGLAQRRQDLETREDFMKQYLQADKDLQHQWVRQQEDAQIQVARSEADFHTQRLRAQRDFNIQIQRMVEDQAKAIYDPYQRIQAQSVWDSQSLLANLAEQNTAILRQTQQIAQLRRMGLSQSAVDLLKLTDPQQAQQVTRLLEEGSASPQILAQLNAQTRQRLAATRGAVVNENNESYRRSRQDFNRQMADSETDFRKSLSRMNEDLQRSHARAQQDLARMGEEVSGTYAEIAQRFVAKVGALPLSAQASLSQNMKTMLKGAITDAATWIDVLLNPYGKQPAVNVTYIVPGGAGGREDRRQGGAGAGPNNFTAPAVGTNVRQSLPNNMQEAFNFAAAQDYHATQNWHGMCDNFVARTWGLSHSGYTTAKTHWAGIPPGYKGGGTAPPGALVFWGNGRDGHVALSAGGGNVWSTDFVRDGQVDIARISDISKQWGGYQGWSYPYFHGQTAPIALGDGGLAMRAGRYELAERGTGEAVIPLNERGARVLAETMVRYADQNTVAAARTQPYSSTVNNGQSYTYDQRVQVLGPVTVPANEPERFLAAMDERARQARLVQPVGRG